MCNGLPKEPLDAELLLLPPTPDQVLWHIGLEVGRAPKFTPPSYVSRCDLLGSRGQNLGPVHGRMDFSRIFIFEPPDFFADFFSSDFFSSFFVGKSAQKNPPRKSWENPPKFIQQKSPTHFCRGAGPTKLENRENDIFGVKKKKQPFLGVPLGTI